jgi:hypothetical protein
LPVCPRGWRYHTTTPQTDSAMPSSRTAVIRCQWFSALAGAFDPRSTPQLALLLLGAI